jgi:hypothetical protein
MNKRDIVARAFQRIGVTAIDEAPQAHETEIGLEMLAQVFADLNGVYGCTLTFTIDEAVPAAYQLGLINRRAARLAPIFQRIETEPETTAMMRIRAANMPYVRDMDLDEDDIVEECEIEAVDRSTWY